MTNIEMTRPGVTVETEDAGTYAGVEPDRLEALVAEIGATTGYLIVTRADRPGAYAQAAQQRRPDGSVVTGGYIVEYHDRPSAHYQATTTAIETVHAVVAGWAYDRPDWRADLAWEPLAYL